MKFSVIVVNYDSWPLTLRCVGSLYATGYEDFEVVVVDNDQQTAPEIPHPIRMIRNRRNLGFARACNQGLKASRGEYLVLLNPDAVVGENFFGMLDDFLASDPRAGVVGPRIVDAHGRLQLSARREVTLISGLVGRTSLLTRLFPNNSLVRSEFPAVQEADRPTMVDWVSGACMVLRRPTLDQIGLLDERFFMYFEDADLCKRARTAGWLVYYLPEVEVLHVTGGSSRSRPKAIWELHKSAFLYHRKHGAQGPLRLYNLLVFAGLALRALAKLASSFAGDFLERSGSKR